MLRLSDTDRDRKGIYPYMTYEEARKYIEYTDTLGSVLGLDSIKELLRRLGDPQNKVKVVHIAGTNGKGSICAFLDGILENAGYVVGRYISPTIFTYLERFQINGTYMDEDTFAVYLERVKNVADAMAALTDRHRLKRRRPSHSAILWIRMWIYFCWRPVWVDFWMQRMSAKVHFVL